MSTTTRDAQRLWKTQVQQVADLKARIEELKTELEQTVSSSAQKASETEANFNKTDVSRAQVEQLHADLETRRQSLEEEITKAKKAQEQAQITQETLEKETATLVQEAQAVAVEVKGQEETVTALLKTATAAGLFHAFDEAQERYRKSALLWCVSTAIALAVSLVLALWFQDATAGQDISPQLIVRKLLIGAPVVYWVVLSTRQFSKAKRYREEYGFKSSVSLSLEAYRDMIRKEAEVEATREQVIPVLATAIQTIMASPSESISKHPQKDEKDLLETALEVMSEQAKALGKLHP